jgi:hypothetical protein
MTLVVLTEQVEDDQVTLLSKSTTGRGIKDVGRKCLQPEYFMQSKIYLNFGHNRPFEVKFHMVGRQTRLHTRFTAAA